MSSRSVRGVIGQTVVKQHRIITLYQDRDLLIQKLISLVSPELTVIIIIIIIIISSLLRHCCLGVRKGIRPVKSLLPWGSSLTLYNWAK